MVSGCGSRNIIRQLWFLDVLVIDIHFHSTGHWWRSDIGECNQEHSCSTEQLVVGPGQTSSHMPPWLSPSAYQRGWLLCQSWLHTWCRTRFYPLLSSQAQSYPPAHCQHIVHWGDATESICLISNLVKFKKPEMGTAMRSSSIHNVCLL